MTVPYAATAPSGPGGGGGGAAAAAAGGGGHFLGVVGLDFGAVGMGGYSGLEEYHDAGVDAGRMDDEKGRLQARGYHHRDVRRERAVAQQQQQQQQQQHPYSYHPGHQHQHQHQHQKQASAAQFGILTPTPMQNPEQSHAYGHARHQNGHQNPAASPSSTDAVPYKIGQGKMVVDPPDLQAWRERLFHVDDVIVLTHEQFETYFPHIDNVYSHRSTQRYKRKPFISHYWDCRMKGRPPGTPKSDDPSKKKRKRSARERDLCDVKIKITEYFADAGAEAALDRDVAAAIAAGTASHAVVHAGQRFWTIQRVNGNGGNGKGDGVAGPHRHTLERSDEIKKNSVQRFVATSGREVKKHKPSQKKATGAAQATVRLHSKETDLQLYAACFCPFSQRVWIALEAKGQPYQYIETDPFKRPASTPLLEANPRGHVPAIRQGDWACSESPVILEYLEDVYPDIPLFPSDPRLRANCRLWIDHINTRLVPTFFALLQSSTPPSSQEPSTSSSEQPLAALQSHLTALVLAADEQGPYFLGPSLSLVDIHVAPFALRLGRLLRDRQPDGGGGVLLLALGSAPGARWQRWQDALERDPHVGATTSTDEFYRETRDLLVRTMSQS